MPLRLCFALVLALASCNGAQSEPISERPHQDSESLDLPILFGSDQDVWRMSNDGLIAQAISETDALELNPEWSADGEQVVFERLPNPDAASEYDIYRMDADGTDVQLVADVADREFNPSWSPDGEWIVFQVEKREQLDLFVVRPDGSDLKRLTKSPSSESNPQWSPDGRLIAFTCTGRKSNICLMRADGSRRRKITSGPGSSTVASWSPSGKRLVFGYYPPHDGLPRLRIISKDGSGLQPVGRRSDQFPIWGPDGSIMFHTVGTDGVPQGIWVMKPDGTARKQIRTTGIATDWLED